MCGQDILLLYLCGAMSSQLRSLVIGTSPGEGMSLKRGEKANKQVTGCGRRWGLDWEAQQVSLRKGFAFTLFSKELPAKTLVSVSHGKGRSISHWNSAGVEKGSGVAHSQQTCDLMVLISNAFSFFCLDGLLLIYRRALPHSRQPDSRQRPALTCLMV